MYEVYRRWPRPLDVITHAYDGEEVVSEPMLRMDRRDFLMTDWSITKPGNWPRYLAMSRAVRQRLRKHPGVVRVHCTHAVPEVVSRLRDRGLNDRASGRGDGGIRGG